MQKHTSSISFLEKKYVRGLENTDILFSSIVYSIPFFIYLVLISLGSLVTKPILAAGGRILLKFDNIYIFGHRVALISIVKQTITSYLDAVIIFFVLVDIFIMQVSDDLIYIVLLILWWYFSKLTKRSETQTFVLGMILLILSPFLLKAGFYQTGEKSAIWAYMFLAAWLLQILRLKRMRP